MKILFLLIVSLPLLAVAQSVETNPQQPVPSIPAAVPPQTIQPKQLTPLNLGYVPTEGESQITFDFSMSSSSGDLKVFNTQFAKVESSSDGGSFTFIYGVSNDFQIGMGISQTTSSGSKYTFGPASTKNGTEESYNDKGTNDPAFGVSYRAPHHDDSPIDLDFGLYHSPKVFKSKASTKTEEGTSARGGYLSLLGVAATTHFDSTDIEGRIQKTILGDRTSESQEAGKSDTVSSGGSAYSISGSILHRYKNLFFGFEYQINHGEGTNSTTDTTKTSATEKEATTMKFTLKHLLNETSGLSFSYSDESTSGYDINVTGGTINAKGVRGTGFSAGYTVAF